MKQLMKSFLPFTLLLIAIISGVVYCEQLAAERSEAFQEQSIEADPMLFSQDLVSN